MRILNFLHNFYAAKTVSLLRKVLMRIVKNGLGNLFEYPTLQLPVMPIDPIRE